MKIHTNVITLDQMHAAAAGLPGVVAHVTPRGSRTHARAFEIYMTGNGVTGGQWGHGGNAKAATWDEWGCVIGRLYVIDPAAVWGSPGNPIYFNADHFNWTTGNRFAVGYLTDRFEMVTLPDDTHARHKWELQGRCVTGAYYVHECKRCSAVTRRMAHGRTFAEIDDNYPAPRPAPAPSLSARVANLRRDIDELRDATDNVGPFALNAVPVPSFN